MTQKNGTLPSPTELNKIIAENGGQDSRIRSQLLAIDLDWLVQLFRNIESKHLRVQSPVCEKLIEAHIHKGDCHRLLLFFRDALQKHALTNDRVSCFLIIFLSWLGNWPGMTAQVLKHCKTEIDVKNAFQYILLGWAKQGHAIALIKYHHLQKKTGQAFLISEHKIHSTFLWPVEEHSREIANEILNVVRDQVETEKQVIDWSYEQVTDWRSVEVLWKRICNEVRCSLHVGGGDRLEIAIPQLNSTRVTGATLQQDGAFPRVKVLLHTNTVGVEGVEHLSLKHGEIEWCNELYTSNHMRWLLTMTILVGYWKIVGTSGRKDREVYSSSASSNGSEGALTRRPAQPHWLKLKPGHKASPEAIANALFRMGRVPVDGNTFREPKDPSSLVNVRVTTVVTPENLVTIMKQVTAI